jgi:hypothetical protein
VGVSADGDAGEETDVDDDGLSALQESPALAPQGRDDSEVRSILLLVCACDLERDAVRGHLLHELAAVLGRFRVIVATVRIPHAHVVRAIVGEDLPHAEVLAGT